MIQMKKAVTKLNSKRNFEKLLFKVMHSVLSGENPVDSLSHKYDNQEILEALFFCQENGLIHGLHAHRMATGTVTCDLSTKLTVSYDGLKFMYECKNNKSLRLSRRANLIAFTALVISAIGTIVQFVSSFQSFSNLLQKIIFFFTT